MIIHKDSKSYETRSSKPNSNFGDYENVFVVPDGSELANKIIQNAPYFDFVLDPNGELTDITPTERPTLQEEPKEPTELEVIQEENANLVFQNAMQDMNIKTLQDENADLLFRLALLEVGASV